jgi:hypothetical protein
MEVRFYFLDPVMNTQQRHVKGVKPGKCVSEVCVSRIEKPLTPYRGWILKKNQQKHCFFQFFPFRFMPWLIQRHKSYLDI